MSCGKALEDHQCSSLQICINASLWGSLISKAKPQGKQCQRCIHIHEPFPGAARLALQVSDPKLGVARQWQQLAAGRMLCAGVAEAHLQQADDIFGQSGSKVRPKAHLFTKKQKPKLLSSQLLSSGCLRHTGTPGASREELPAHATTQPMRSHPCKRGQRWPRLAGFVQTDGHPSHN